jgi:uncharacterized membrane protein SpoIIM required for sporulation
MRETQFLKQNKDRWQYYEKSPTHDPDDLAERFIQLTDDLAYARTFYPKSRTVQYLNSLASHFHLAIYRNRKEKTSRFVLFWTSELPLTLYRYRRDILYSFLFFFVFFLIGWLSASKDDHFIRLILGDGYVNMTNENIEKGDPFGVYKQREPFLMFLQIALNNIQVSFVMYVLGIFACVWTLYLMFRNGLMLGSFMYYFFSKGLGTKAVLVIFIHGTIEISSLIIAGACGLILGKSWMFPGTYRRSESLVKGARDSIKISLCLVLFLLVAAFFESFVTRHTGMPTALSILILAGSLYLMAWYFILFPAKVNRLLDRQEEEALTL